MKFQLRTEKILISGIALLLLAIVIIIAVSISQSQQVNRTAKMVEHTQEVLIIYEKLLSFAIDNNETGSLFLALATLEIKRAGLWKNLIYPLILTL